MREAINLINLAYMLNAHAHVAMSYLSIRGEVGPGKSEVVLKKLERLFHDYRPK
jgi:hypothetical protein